MKLYFYKTPGVNENIALGILHGIEFFFKSKIGVEPEYCIGDWSNVRNDGLNIFLTKNSVTHSRLIKAKKLSGNIIFKAKELNDFRHYIDSKRNISYLRVLRGVIAGYNELARLFNLDCCTNEHCAFNFEKKDLDTLAFLLHLNKEIPLCRHHNNWRY